MSERANQLRRQRDLLRDHLAWIERELAAAEAVESVPDPALRAASPPRPGVPAAAAPIAPSAGADLRDADAILADFRRAPDSIAMRTKLGCALYFGIAMAIVIAVLAALYLYVKAHRG